MNLSLERSRRRCFPIRRGSTAFFGGLQVVPSTFTLGSKSVAAGSLLLFDGQNNPDTVVAVDPSSGTIINTLALGKNYDLTAGVYDPTSKNLIVVDRVMDAASGTFGVRLRLPNPDLALPAGIRCTVRFASGTP